MKKKTKQPPVKLDMPFEDAMKKALKTKPYIYKNNEKSIFKPVEIHNTVESDLLRALEAYIKFHKKTV